MSWQGCNTFPLEIKAQCGAAAATQDRACNIYPLLSPLLWNFFLIAFTFSWVGCCCCSQYDALLQS